MHPASASGPTGGAAGCDAFVSGTAAIVGHTTVAPGDTAAQLACTLDNLAAISRACGLGRDLGAGRSAARFFKVYLRHAADFAPVAAQLERALLGPGDEVTYLHADICRATLNIEIEATILGAPAIPTVGG